MNFSAVASHVINKDLDCKIKDVNNEVKPWQGLNNLSDSGQGLQNLGMAKDQVSTLSLYSIIIWHPDIKHFHT